MILYDELIQTNTCKIDGIIIKQAYKTNYRKFEDTYNNFISFICQKALKHLVLYYMMN